MSGTRKTIDAARKFTDGYFDPEKNSIPEFQRKIEIQKNALNKTTDKEDQDLLIDQIQGLKTQLRSVTGAPNASPPINPKDGSNSPPKPGRDYTKKSVDFGGKRRTKRKSRKTKKRKPRKTYKP